MYPLIFAALLALGPNEGNPPIMLTAPPDTPVVIQRGDTTVSVFGDRISILPAGAARPLVVLIDGGAGPTPVPPIPPPPPTPNPKPTPYAGPLWGVLVLPDNPTPEQAAWRLSARLRAGFAAASTATGPAIFTSHLASEQAVQRPDFQAALARTPPPALLWVDKDGRVLINGKAAPVASEQDVLDNLKDIRGS